MRRCPVSSPPQTTDRLSRHDWVKELRQKLTPPTEELTKSAHQLVNTVEPLNDDYLKQTARRMANRSVHLQATIERLISLETPEESELGYRRGVRHDLRAAASYIVSASDDIAESVPSEQRTTIEQVLTETRSAADWVIRSIEELFQNNDAIDASTHRQPELLAELRERLPKLLGRDQTRTDVEPNRILIVDDNEFGRDLLARMLTQQGHIVEVLPGASEAQTRLLDLNSPTIDLILLDVLMPGMSGPELLHWLKQQSNFWHLPVIMVSALGEDDSVLACIAAGAEDYLTRPVRAELLRARITGCLEKKRLRDREVEYQARIASLVRAIFPPAMVQEWESTGTIRPRNHECVGVLFTDIVGFTALCEQHRDQPEQVVELLQKLVERFEETVSRHGVQKVKTIGDGFMCVAGITEDDPCPARTLLTCALDMIADAREHPARWQVRIGIHIGPVVSGVLGKRQFSFDLWGHTVNAAARVEANGMPDKVTLSNDAWLSLDGTVEGNVRTIQARGIGPMTVWDFRQWNE